MAHLALLLVLQNKTKMKKIFILLVYAVSLSSSFGQSITGGEYFFDTAPALGGGTAFSVSAGSTVQQTLTMPISSLSAGFHTVFVRVKNASDVWSHYEGRTFYIIPPAVTVQQTTLVAGESFIDTDPGLGSGAAFTFAPGNTAATTIALNTTDLNTGFHNLFIRVKNNADVWSHYEGRVFYIIPTAEIDVQAPLVAGEWFIDKDPGDGAGSPITFTKGNLVNTTISIETSGLSIGSHTLYIRVQDENGTWSLFEGRPFSVSTLGTVENEISTIKVFPNPTNSIVNLEATNNTVIYKIVVTDMAGKKVLEQTANTSQINVQALAKGMYVIEMFVGDKKEQSKFIKE
jgi:hypothetical protein